MKLRYFEDTDSFVVRLGEREYQHSATVSYDFLVDLDWDELVSGIECLGARRNLGIRDLSTTPPEFKWLTLTDGEPPPCRASDRVRYFIHRPALDTLYMEFALGDTVDTEPVIDGVYAELNADGGIVGLHIANASRNVDLDTILADGPPEVVWEPHPVPVIAVVPSAEAAAAT